MLCQEGLAVRKAFLFCSRVARHATQQPPADKLETVQIGVVARNRIVAFSFHHGDDIQQREVKMNERRFRWHRVCSLPALGIFLFALAVLGIAVYFPVLPSAIAGNALWQEEAELPDWQRYVAWHESWHYVVLEDARWNCLLAGAETIIQR
ncbi:MAG TPA: hypothetical protein VN361_03680 [Oxalicibacterium sp.]|nr:hypothetical protein [Oxalicibacterium sp.]